MAAYDAGTSFTGATGSLVVTGVADRAIAVCVLSDTEPDDVFVEGVAMGAPVLSDNIAGIQRTIYELAGIPSGTLDIEVDGGGTTYLVQVHAASGVDQTAVLRATPQVATGTLSSGTPEIAVDATSAVGDIVIDFGVLTNTTAIAVSSGQTQVVNGLFAGGIYRQFTSYKAGGASTTEMAWTASPPPEPIGYLAAVAFQGAVAAGPTITVQPVADTGLINGDATRRTTVYTATATGTNVDAPTWSVDGSPIADGGIYDIVTTGAGTASCSSTLTITRTVKTGTPFDIAANFADDNGDTDTDTVADTWFTGPVLSKSSGTTNGSGVDTLTITSDYPNADGEFTVVTASAGGVTKQISLHYE